LTFGDWNPYLNSNEDDERCKRSCDNDPQCKFYEYFSPKIMSIIAALKGNFEKTQYCKLYDSSHRLKGDGDADYECNEKYEWESKHPSDKALKESKGPKNAPGYSKVYQKALDDKITGICILTEDCDSLRVRDEKLYKPLPMWFKFDMVCGAIFTLLSSISVALSLAYAM